MSYNILSLDGGGVRGVLSAIWLVELCRRYPRLLPSIDLFAGTSMGAANVAAFAKGVSAERILDIYREDGKHLFGKPGLPPAPMGWVAAAFLKVGGSRAHELLNLIWPKYDQQGLNDELARVFGRKELLADLPYRIVLPALQLSKQLNDSSETIVAPRLIHNFPNSPFVKTSVHDAVMRSMSAPTYFSSYQGYVDGGVFATNPTMAAIGLALSEHGASQSLSDIRVLSLGTGICADGVANNGTLNWGILQWARKFPDAAMTSELEFDAENTKLMLGVEHYARLNAVLPGKGVPMDDYKAADKLIEFAQQQIDTENFERVANFVENNILNEIKPIATTTESRKEAQI